MFHACPACNSEDFKELGPWGGRMHVRCCDCGIDFSFVMDEEEDDEPEDNEPSTPDDFSDDAAALASAGWGMDEDYGSGFSDEGIF
jgi:hypothetical protein